MTDPERREARQIERLVRASLDRSAEGIDPRAMFDRLIRENPAPAAVSRRRRKLALPRRWATLTAAALALVACLVLFRQEHKVFAEGEAVVLGARQAHRLPIDRCYLVEVRRDSSLAAELAPSLPAVRSTRLWTRGDRFWVESTRLDQRWAWGRDEANRFWMALGSHTGLRFEADEVPDWLNLYGDLHSLNVEKLLDDVIGRFVLTREAGPDPSTIRVVARPRSAPGRTPGIQSAELEVDAETRVIRRMVVRRALNGQPFATVTYSLTETEALDPARYQIEGHLTDPSEIFTRDHEPQRRLALLTRALGLRPARWLRPSESPK